MASAGLGPPLAGGRPRRPGWHWRIAGLALVAAYLAQDAADASWPALAALQAQDWYKYATGAGLVAYVAWLWALFLRRRSGLRGPAAVRFRAQHEKSAAFAPCLFYFHSMQVGYGYQAVLSGALLAAVVIGTLSPQALGIRARLYLAVWSIVHVALAAALVVLALYHGYIALYYK